MYSEELKTMNKSQLYLAKLQGNFPSLRTGITSSDIEFEIAHQPNTAAKTIIQPNKLSKIALCDLNRR